MKNKTIANWLIGSMALGLIPMIFPESSEGFYTLAGLGIMVFLVIASLRLKKSSPVLSGISLGVLVVFWLAFATEAGAFVTLMAVALWVASIWECVVLYKTKD